ncbi:DUF3987 domain-containing protein [Salegentibacter sp. HM20]
MNTEFNPSDWLNPEPKINGQQATGNRQQNPEQSRGIEDYIKAIETANTDLTPNYPTWRDLGFALAEEFGEAGRDYFHRISRFHPGYNSKECDEQYKKCLEAKGSGISIATFYHHFHKAGLKLPAEKVEVKSVLSEEKASETEDSDEEEEMPTFPEDIYYDLPEFLQKVVEPATSSEERDILLLGSLTSLSACFPKLYGIYDGKKIYPNLYLFVTAPASAGKGRLSLCKKLVLPIHKNLREQAKMLKLQYASELAEYNMEKNQTKEKPGKPPERMLFIPANNSTTGVFQLLSDNKGHGLIFETEGDTLAQSFKSDYGNYSDGFRKAFHHETISYYRRTDREYVDIETPCLSTVLSGTPKQITSLIPSAENGLFSRFIFYYMNLKPIWKNVFEVTVEDGIDQYYLDLGEEFLGLYQGLLQAPPLRIYLSPGQQSEFNTYFTNLQTRYLNLEDEEYIATVRRLGLIAFRMMMLLSALRIMEDADLSSSREVETRDFKIVMQMVKILVLHSSRVFSHLPEEAKLNRRKNRKERFLDALPLEFTREKYLEIAANLKLVDRTVDRYISQFVKAGLIIRESQNSYLNCAKIITAQTGKTDNTAQS